MEPESSVDEERAERIAELERRMKPGRPVGVKAPVAAFAVVLACAMIWMDRRELSYFFSPHEPVTLGTEGEYRFEQLRSNRYAQVHGVPTLRAAYTVDRERTWVLVGLKDTPIVVRREALPGESWGARSKPPQPDQRPFGVRGRLLSRADAPAYADAFKQLLGMGEVRERDKEAWLLIEGERPGSDWAVLAWATGLGAFAALNAWLLWRDLRLRWSRLRQPREGASGR